MRVLHYMFGIPPVRTGGLVRYATDLMEQELRMGEDVRLLIPGILPFRTKRRTRIYRTAETYGNIPAYAVYHPLPVPMCNGIRVPEAFMRQCIGTGYRDFLRFLKPDLIHVHTFMGLHREFLDEAQILGIPVVFTSHDYFGICPTALMAYGGRICGDSTWNRCIQCSQGAFPGWRLFLEQSGLYREFRKKERLVGMVKRFARRYIAEDGSHTAESGGCTAGGGRYTAEGGGCTAGGGSHTAESGGCTAGGGRHIADSVKRAHRADFCVADRDYSALREYYASMFCRISCFHFNSTLAEQIYRARLGDIRGVVAGISHRGIADHRDRRSFGRTLRIGYIGSWTRHKGFFDLMAACASLRDRGCTDLELHLYSGTDRRTERFVRNHPAFGQAQLGEILDDMDVLVMPSRCPETFGFGVLEAVSYGVPVILSDTVGAKDIFAKTPQAGFVYNGSRQELIRLLERIYKKRELLKQANTAIRSMEYDFSYERHVREILAVYANVCGEHRDGHG